MTIPLIHVDRSDPQTTPGMIARWDGKPATHPMITAAAADYAIAGFIRIDQVTGEPFPGGWRPRVSVWIGIGETT